MATKRRLKEIIKAIEPVSVHGSLDCWVDGLSFDAFTVLPGELFLATEGVNSDRHQYIESVLDRGIRAIVHSKPLTQYRKDTTYIRVENVQRSMSPISAAFHNHPSKTMFVIGVTGTNGKSTTCSFIYQLIKLFSKRPGIISSVTRDTGTGIEDNAKHQSTPEAPVIHRCLADAAANGVEYMVLEATSHGLSPKNNRVGDVEFNAAVMTNVTHEHLEFHGTMERYIDDKANLFRLMDRYGRDRAFGVVNNDDPSAAVFAAASGKPVYSYGIEAEADFRALDVRLEGASASFTVKHGGARFPVVLPLSGSFNVSNALAASVTVSRALGVPFEEVTGKISLLEGVRGRMNAINRGQPFEVIVDFAHTPDSFGRLLPEMKMKTNGRLMVVFGSGGQRDTTKRAIQGEIASRYADLIILSDEDPRGEDPVAILEQIAGGCRGAERNKTLFLIPDRRAAILKAIRTARAGDTVLLLGKGHETTISYKDGDIPWDEATVARDCLKEAGYQ
ncbi:MAG: UDP-N-acetylmuramoyl-L-alanyl-D-glutamate--2,6-diaminopimelate ligase [Spirochaetales bacterium]|nr:UDP-N-acetylmuramoyl-L-alanyl-D-glutamate--2,6-diaminopimelate ligase [Spirochaetales bacterium]